MSDFKKNLVRVAQIFDHKLTEARMHLFSDVISNAVKFQVDWERVAMDIAEKEIFFPLPAVWIRYAKNIAGVPESTHLQAVDFVDRVIAALYSPNAYESLGKEDYDLMKTRLKVGKYDVEHGIVKPQFMRAQWIEIMDRFFENTKRTQNQIEGGKDVRQIEGSD